MKGNTVNVGLVQINNSFSGQNYLPYAVGLLQSYVQNYSKKADLVHFLPLIYKRTRIEDAVTNLKHADIVGFSTYVWNSNVSLEIAKRLKLINPKVMIIFGGPHVPDNPEKFLKKNPFIDLVVHNEGEQTFLRLIDSFPDRLEWENIPGISFIDEQLRYIKVPTCSRIGNLDLVPSPFLNGIFDDLIASNPEESWIGLWETNRGCPFQCTYCDWGSAIATKLSRFSLDRLYAEIDWFASNRIEYVFCCDANFGIDKRDVDIASYIAKVKSATGYPHRLSVQNTKNATERAYESQKILSDSGLNQGVALSMQTLDPVTLVNIKRSNISLDTYFELQRRFTKDKVETYSDLILGLPGETYDSFVEGIDTLITNGQHNRIQFNNLTVLPNAEISNPDYITRFGIKTISSNIINLHGDPLFSDDDVREEQEIVIATATTSLVDWRRTRAICWMTALLHFDKIFQIPLIIAHELTKIRYRALFEGFMGVDGGKYPLVGEIRDFFLSEATKIQEGGPEYVYSPEWLNIYWPADEYIFIKLTAENNMSRFYKEATNLLLELVGDGCTSEFKEIMTQAVTFNQTLVKQPFVKEDIKISLSYDIFSFYNDIRNNEATKLIKKKSVIEVKRSMSYYDNFHQWCREVVWWGNKKGAYLYTNNNYIPELAGHY